MEMRTNAGYTITDSVHIGKAEFVIGEMPNAPAPFVTWECKNGNNYFWGHYFLPAKRRNGTYWNAQGRNWNTRAVGRSSLRKRSVNGNAAYHQTHAAGGKAV
ncbi:MAG: hypothetical protein ACLRR6_05055 [Oscillospiraceae bacterium]